MSAQDRTGVVPGGQPARSAAVAGALLLAGWSALAMSGGGIDVGDGLPGGGPTGVAVALAVTAPAAAIAAWSLRTRGEVRTWPAALALGGAGGAVLWSLASIAWAAAADLAWVAGNRAAIGLCVLIVASALACRLTRPATALVLGVSAAAVPPVAWALMTKLTPGLAGERATGRLQEPVGYWNALALVCALAVPGALVLASLGRGGTRGRWQAPVAAAWIVLLVVTCLLTLSRSGLLVLLVAGAIALWAVRPRRPAVASAVAALIGAALPAAYALTTDTLTADEIAAAARADAGRELAWRLAVGMVLAAVLAALADRRRRTTTVAAAAGVVLALGVVGAPQGGLAPVAPAPAIAAESGDRDDTLANDPSRLTDASANLRGRWWGEAWRGFTAAPVIGNGAGGFRLVELRERRDADDALLTREAHQVLLGTLSATGLVGGLLLGMIVAGVGWAAVRAWRRNRDQSLLTLALIVPVALQSQVDWTASIPVLLLVVAAAAGVLVVLAAPAATVAPPAGEPFIAGLLSLGAVLLVASALLPWGAQTAVTASQNALAEDDGAAALDAARLAARLDPLSPRPDWARAEAFAAAGRRDAALRAYLDAADRQPDNPATWRRVALAAGGGPLARDAWARASRLDPMDPVARERAAGT